MGSGAASDVVAAIAEVADPDRAVALARYFKTGPGEYGEGDVFVGVTVPEQRRIARTFRDLPLGQVRRLLRSKVHEHRLTGLLVLVDRYRRGDEATRAECHALYISELVHVNNWDLVDLTAPDVVGDFTRGRIEPLLPLARSPVVWERRVAVLACFADIRAGELDRALAVADLLAHDEHDLIQKAIGWMLREVGKRCGREVLVAWLLADGGRYRTLPRTELRYAIEHFAPAERAKYLAGTA